MLTGRSHREARQVPDVPVHLVRRVDLSEQGRALREPVGVRGRENRPVARLLGGGGGGVQWTRCQHAALEG